MNSTSRTSLGFLLTGVLGVIVGAFVVACTTGHFLNGSSVGQASNIASAAPLRGASTDLEQRLIDTVKRTEPSVVLIQSTVHGQQIQSPFGNDPFFRQFFGDQGPGVAQPFTPKASGSGFIIKREGESAIVATNAHVIYHADKISVLLSTGRRVDAKVMGSDIRTDLALLKITGSNLPPALPVGNSNALQQGQFVLAIGEPEEFQNSVSFGIVSALHRTSIVAGGQENIPAIHYQDMIQTTTPINPG
ncbi:MAG: trypsin-like peptidase domain-containing protein, partial [Candidatus Eremiobacteraeota bacterium]|nr:trypsin-like peptidase domain-containing protein [Candidatus Eremiobacteraeota bacterium]